MSKNKLLPIAAEIRRANSGILPHGTLRQIQPPCWVRIATSPNDERGQVFFAGYEEWAGEKRARLYATEASANGPWRCLASLSHPAERV